ALAPGRPQPRERQRPPILTVDVERLLAGAFASPFVESAGRDEATLGAHGVTEGRFLCRALRAGVEQVRLERRRVLHPVRHQAPAHGRDLARAVLALDHHLHLLRRRDVVPRGQRERLDLEQRRQVVLVVVQGVATTHGYAPLLGRAAVPGRMEEPCRPWPRARRLSPTCRRAPRSAPTSCVPCRGRCRVRWSPSTRPGSARDPIRGTPPGGRRCGGSSRPPGGAAGRSRSHGSPTPPCGSPRTAVLPTRPPPSAPT